MSGLSAQQRNDMNRAVQLMEAGRLDEAARLAGAVAAAGVDDPQVDHFLGFVSLQRNEVDAALRHLERAADRLDRDPSFLANLGEALRRAGRAEAALARFEAARAAEPGNPAHDHNVGNALFDLHRWDEAEAAYRAALARAPNLAYARANLGSLLLRRGDYAGAAEESGAALQFLPQDPGLYVNLGRALKQLGRLDEAEERARTALALRPGWASAEALVGECARDRGRTDEALAAFERALAADPGFTAARVGLAQTLVNAGRFDAAAAAADALLADDPGQAEALVLLAQIGRIAPGDARLDRLAVLVDDTAAPPDWRVSAAFAAAEVHDRAGAHDAAFALWSKGNAITRGMVEDETPRAEALAGRMAAAADAALFERLGTIGSEDARPVFVVGMPRSGTTLAERVVAAHPRGAGAGELHTVGHIVAALPRRTQAGPYPDCLRALDPPLARTLAHDYLEVLAGAGGDAARIVDKMPNNFLHLGLIALLFPRARIVHCVRHPLDIGLSCYAQNFGTRQTYTTDLASLARYYRLQVQLMAHWRAVLPVPILELRYEDVVAGPEPAIRRLIDFCGLEWDDRCLRFHEAGGSVRTASRVQVRRPLYASSVGRWRAHADHLAPLAEALGDLIPGDEA